MTLPASRNTNYSASDPVKAADLNAIQDCIVGGLHDTLKLALSVAGGRDQAGSTTYNVGVTLAAASTYHIPVPLKEGDQITDIKVFYARNDASTMQFALRETNLTGSSAILVEKDIVAGAGNANTSLATAPTTGSLPRTLAADKNYVIALKGGAGAVNVVWGVIVFYKR